MSNKKSRFFVLRSPLLWVVLGLAITLIGLSVETAAHIPAPKDPEIRFRVNLINGQVTMLAICPSCVPTPKPKLSVPVNKVYLTFYDSTSNCVTIYHNGSPFEVCTP